jgi:UDP-hydrolysing UDP-N-acetyl-D-glucosamine 2-epimerase
LLSKEALEKDLGIHLTGTVFLVTYHPETLSGISAADAFGQLLSALDKFPEARIIFTYPNADTDGHVIIKMINEYTAAHKSRVFVYTSLGQTRYLSVMKIADAVIGNSSSGIIEAPAMHVPVVNIGDRQKGRLRAGSIIDCEISAVAITSAIQKALTPEFKSIAAKARHPYGDGHAAERIFTELKSCQPAKLIHKTFYDLH